MPSSTPSGWAPSGWAPSGWAPSGWDGTATAGAVLYLILFAAALWGTWLLVRGGPGGREPS